MGMGNPLLDISADVPEDMLTKYDVKLDSAILAEEKHMPIYQELVESYNATFIAGGATQNSESERGCQDWSFRQTQMNGPSQKLASE